MFFIRLFNYFKGYVAIIIEGVFPERFLNICARRGISLWNVKRLGKLSLRANVSVRGFRLLRPIAKKSRCGVKVSRRVGLRFYVHKHRKRKAFVFGAALFAVLLLVMTRFIWVIEVTGVHDLTRQQILEALEESGLKVGQLSAKINISDIQNTVITRQEKIAWLGITVKGTTAHVDVKERTSKPEIFPKDQPCSIYAGQSGVVESIEAQNGQRLVSAGDVVKQGQLLISGVLDSKTGLGVRYVHADGEVIARTWHEVSVPIASEEEVRRRTGRSKSKHMLKAFSLRIPLFFSDRVGFAGYDRVSEAKWLHIGKDTPLPFSFHYDKYYELEITRQPMERETAVAEAEAEARRQVAGIQIVSEQKEVTEDTVKITFECIENITQKQTVLREENHIGGEEP